MQSRQPRFDPGAVVCRCVAVAERGESLRACSMSAFDMVFALATMQADAIHPLHAHCASWTLNFAQFKCDVIRETCSSEFS